jgi:hypothetical protein
MMNSINDAATGGSGPFAMAAAAARSTAPGPEPADDREGRTPAAAPANVKNGARPATIEPPPSWSDDKELFASLPRPLQQSLARGERLRAERLAELHAATEAERPMLEATRQQYETALPQLLEAMQQQHLSEFADIKTPADIGRMAREDAGRYVRWDLQQRRIAEVTQEVSSAHERIRSPIR